MKREEQVLKYKDHVVFGRQYIPNAGRFAKTYVENEACFIFVNKGEFAVRSQEEKKNFDKSQALLAKCLNYFFETTASEQDEIEAIGVILYPSLVKEIFEFDLNTSNFNFEFNVKQVEVDKLLENFKQSIEILLDNPEIADDNLVKAKLKEFVLLLTKSQGAPSQLDFLAAMFKPNEVAFKTVIKNNLYANLSLEELASLSHLSLSSFKRKFKENFGESPKKYIARKKIEKASEMIRTGDQRISEIAYDVGFDSLATFNRNFSNIIGKSPSEYKVS